MKRIYLKLYTYYISEDKRQVYINIEKGRTNAMELYILNARLEPESQDPQAQASQDDKSTLIWSYDSFKKRERKEFATWQEEQDFEKKYDKYYDKRWDDMPKIDLSNQDYENILKQWESIKERKPKYLIFELDNSGPLDKVTIIEKEELSDQDYENMKRDHEEYLRWEKAKEKYIEDHPDYSDDLWRGPQDDEYDADIAQFLDKD